MKNTITIAAITLLGVASVKAQILTNAYNPANGHTYYLLQQSTWSVAESEAITLGGHLATINDAAEDNWVAITLSNFGGVQRGLWIGLTDQDHEGTFTWVDGDPSTYRHWEDGQPDNGGGSGAENYVNIWPNPGGRDPGTWNDYNGHDDNWFGAPFCGVVEVVPEPSAVAFMGIGTIVFLFRRRPRA